MALLIQSGVKGWMTDDEIAAAVRRFGPDLDIRTPDTLGVPTDIRMLAVSTLHPDVPKRLPRLALVQKLGAGVETIVNHPALAPQVRVTRLRPDAPAREIAEFFLAYVLRSQRHMDHYDTAQHRAEWLPIEPREADKTVVGVLGLGHIGGRTARMFRDIGFQVEGWSRSPKEIEGVTCHHGPDTLAPMLGRCDYVAAILPSTAATRDMFDAALLARMNPTGVLLNAGRGDLIVEDDLIAALDAGCLAHAVLDVTRIEPLPASSPLWYHDKVTITPHVSGWHLGDALKDVAENLRRLQANAPLLHQVDRAEGY
ncbi:MAG: glyoxylate/hydroxypyruvate reductase A [Rhodobacteraceae bacterium]|nr:glyoxylate/hydroxypyruvate reductase A [Paracoccaceae bacterium]